MMAAVLFISLCVDLASFTNAKRWAIAIQSELNSANERMSEREASWFQKRFVNTLNVWNGGNEKYINLNAKYNGIKTKGILAASFFHSFRQPFIDGINHEFWVWCTHTHTHHRLPGVFTVIYFINVMLFTISEEKKSILLFK